MARNDPSQVDVTSRRLLLDDFFKIEEARLRFERFDGELSPEVRRLNLDRGDAVAALLVKPKAGNVILVNQFRYPAYTNGAGWITELVAGICEIGESPEETIRREILEEAGYHVGRLEMISQFFPSPGGSSERIFLYHAEVDESLPRETGGGEPSEGED
ncbi:MAG: NUDIX domain-containing protein, partial [bacterium]|nr:NUDIX domain-containing protein [bacterium]